MTIPLPKLDDRRWSDLVEEGRTLLPLVAPDWTDHNAHDPGITLLELFAWWTEADIFTLDQVPERNRRKFLELVGVRPAPPRPAHMVVRFTIDPGRTARVPAGTALAWDDPFGVATEFRTARNLDVAPVAIVAIQVPKGTGLADVTRRIGHGEPIELFGPDPVVGAAFYIGLDAPMPPQASLRMEFIFDDPLARRSERERILDAWRKRRERCRPREAWPCGNPPAPTHSDPAGPPTLEHHAARMVWEIDGGAGRWESIGRVVDDTRSFTLDGGVTITLDRPMQATRVGHDDTPRHYLRCRLAAGSFDASPIARTIVLNAVEAEQVAEPAFDSPTPAAIDGRKVQPLGVGDGSAHQRTALSSAPVVESSVRVFTGEDGGWREWRRRPDLDASHPVDDHFVLDATHGTIVFGDGVRGRAVPDGASIAATWLATRAEAGNLVTLSPGRFTSPAPDASLAVANVTPAEGGAGAEPLDHAEGRARRELGAAARAVTLADVEELARLAPGARLARVQAFANTHPDFPCDVASGVVALLVMPFLPAPRPTPSAGLLRWVQSFIEPHRVVGTRIVPFGPEYVTITIQAQLKARPRASSAAIVERSLAALRALFDPLTGGSDGNGWPFGRDVYRSEVLGVLDQVPGVDHVRSLEMSAGDTCPGCGNVCVGRFGLVVSGPHRIEVVS